MVSKRAPRKSNIFNKFIKGPIWVLAQVRDMYVQSLTGAAGHVNYGNAMGCPTPHISSLPRSSSVNSSKSSFGTTEADLRELIRAASTRGGGAKAELFRSKSTAMGGGASVPRSITVGFGRIDEDKPFEYEDDKSDCCGGVQVMRFQEDQLTWCELTIYEIVIFGSLVFN